MDFILNLKPVSGSQSSTGRYTATVVDALARYHERMANWKIVSDEDESSDEDAIADEDEVSDEDDSESEAANPEPNDIDSDSDLEEALREEFAEDVDETLDAPFETDPLQEIPDEDIEDNEDDSEKNRDRDLFGEDDESEAEVIAAEDFQKQLDEQTRAAEDAREQALYPGLVRRADGSACVPLPGMESVYDEILGDVDEWLQQFGVAHFRSVKSASEPDAQDADDEFDVELRAELDKAEMDETLGEPFEPDPSSLSSVAAQREAERREESKVTDGEIPDEESDEDLMVISVEGPQAQQDSPAVARPAQPRPQLLGLALPPHSTASRPAAPAIEPLAQPRPQQIGLALPQPSSTSKSAAPAIAPPAAEPRGQKRGLELPQMSSQEPPWAKRPRLDLSSSVAPARPTLPAVGPRQRFDNANAVVVGAPGRLPTPPVSPHANTSNANGRTGSAQTPPEGSARKKPEQEIAWKCKYCSKVIRSKYNFEDHANKEHNLFKDGKPYAGECGMCDKKFKKTEDLEKHKNRDWLTFKWCQNEKHSKREVVPPRTQQEMADTWNYSEDGRVSEGILVWVNKKQHKKETTREFGVVTHEQQPKLVQKKVVVHDLTVEEVIDLTDD